MSNRTFEAVVAGHVCLDITPTFGRSTSGSLSELLRPGKLLRMEGVGISPGGAVGNTGPALHKLGVPVALMGKCGGDPFGHLLVDRLAGLAPGAEAGMRMTPGENTSYTIVIAPPGIDRMFLHCPDANDTFGPEDVDAEVLRGARLFHFGYPPLMRRMYEDNGAEGRRLLAEAAERVPVVSLDLSLPDPDSDAGRADWQAILAAMLPHVDVFLPSLDELLFMLDRDLFDRLTALGNVADQIGADELHSLAERCVQMGAGVVVVKCGHAGAYMLAGRPSGAFCGAAPGAWAGRSIFQPACRVGSVVSATGAGDVAIAGFLAAWLRGEPPERCMAALAACGAQNLAGFDSVSALKPWPDTLADITAGLDPAPVPERLRALCG